MDTLFTLRPEYFERLLWQKAMTTSQHALLLEVLQCLQPQQPQQPPDILPPVKLSIQPLDTPPPVELSISATRHPATSQTLHSDTGHPATSRTFDFSHHADILAATSRTFHSAPDIQPRLQRELEAVADSEVEFELKHASDAWQALEA